MSRSKDISHLNGKPQFQGPVPLIGQGRPQNQDPPAFTRMDDDLFPEDFVPLQDSVIVRRIERVEKQGNIVIAEVGEAKVIWGEVVAVGPGRISDVNGRHVKPQSEKGDLVMIPLLQHISTPRLRCKTEELLVFHDGEIRVKVRRRPESIAPEADAPAPSTIVTE